MAVPLRMNKNKSGVTVLARLRTLIYSQTFHSRAPKGPLQDQSSPEKDLDYSICRGSIGVSEWKTLDARNLGVTSSMISYPSQFVLKLLRSKGFESYLVGGCVRDLLLNRTPKDFDVITTAKLVEVRKQFRRSARAEVVGRRFPVCLVHIKGSVVEVTSFETVARSSNGKEQYLYSLLPKCSNKEDLLRCKNSLRRDFTINSLFYDPFANKIYDYTNGMADLRSLKLETIIPAKLSFKEDPGRILRGFRIAARLGLSLSREIEAAIWKYSSLVKSLDKAVKEDGQPSNMLMKLFFHLDNLVACDRPCDCTLWIGLLAFHLALVKNPQDALVVWAFASVLYHGEWKEGVTFAKEHAEMFVNFAPEIKTSSTYISDEQIAKAVTKLASLLMHSIPALVQNNSLLQFMSKYPSFPHAGMVFVSRKTGKHVSEIFEMVANDVEFYKSKRRKNAKINYALLGKGDLSETGFVLGKIVLETMSSGIDWDGEDSKAEKCCLTTEGTEEVGRLDLVNHQLVARNDEGQVLSIPNPECRQEKIKKQKLVKNRCIAEEKMDSGKYELFGNFEHKETNEEHQKLVNVNQKVDLSMTKDSLPKKKISLRKQLINDRKKITNANKSSLDQARHMKMDEHNTCTPSQSPVSENQQVIANNNIDVDAKTTNGSDVKKKKKRLSLFEVFGGKERQKPHKNKKSVPPLPVPSSDE